MSSFNAGGFFGNANSFDWAIGRGGYCADVDSFEVTDLETGFAVNDVLVVAFLVGFPAGSQRSCASRRP